MVNKTLILRNIVKGLRKNAANAYKIKNYSMCNYIIEEYNKVASNISAIEGAELASITLLNNCPYEWKYPESLHTVIVALDKITDFLDGMEGTSEESVNQLKSRINKKEGEIQELKEREKALLEISKNSRSAKSYPINEEILKKFSPTTLKPFNEALSAYSVGAYTACVCVCRNLIQFFVQELCVKNNVKEGSLNAQIEKLIELKVIESEHHSKILDVAKFFGHRSAHPTAEIFNQEKANLIISSIIILNEELFNID